LRDPSILNITKMRNSPTVIEHHTGNISWPGKDPNVNVSFADAVVGYDFTKTMNLQIEAGRDFSRDYADTTSFILNEAAVNKIGLKDPVGKQLSWGGRDGFVVGVIKDFNFSSLHKAIEPLILRLDENWNWGTILVRIKAGETRKAIGSLEGICRQFNPQFPFTYQFSDLEYTRLYKSETVVSKLSNLFAFLAILISSLGLLGLAIYTAEQRKKELGVRKVLGASAGNIIVLLSRNFLNPVIVAMVIAFPVAWFAMKGWLQNFEYRIDIAWWFFAVAGIIALAIAFLTICYQSIKSAIANPVTSLRTE
jgi:putative ABC transport system permease protein